MVRKPAKKAASPASVIYPDGCERIDSNTNNSTLVLALKALYERLSEDETATEDNFESLATHLVSSELLNKPADVSVYVALCLARIFCICPTNPFELRNEELREALDFLAKSIGRIRCENEALFTKYHSLLEMVSNHSILQHNLKHLDPETEDGARVVATLLKSAALVVEIRKAAERVQDEKNEQEIERKSGVRTMIHNICRGVLEDNADHIHPIALDVIFSHLITPEKGNNPEAYHLMRKLCEHGTVYIHPRILSIFVQACQSQEDPKLDTEHFKLVGKRRSAVYELLSELSDVLPDIRNDLLSLLSAKLASSDAEVRLLAMKTAAEVAKKRQDLPESCESLWTRFVHLSRDTSPAVRKELAERVKDLLYANHDMRSTIWDFLVRLIVDSDEEVRMAAIETVCLTARNKLEAVNEKLIECCTERLKDRKTEVRKCALKHLLALYKEVVRREESTKSDRGSVAIIAKKTILLYIYNTSNTPMTEEKVIIEKGLINSLLPMELPMRRRMELLVEMSTRLDKGEFSILHELLKRVVVGRRLLSSMMDCISVRKDGDMRQERSQEEKKKITEQCIEKLVKFFPHSHKAESSLRKFVNLLCVDNEAVKQMEIILRKETNVVEAKNAVTQLLSRLGSGRDDMNKEQEEMIRSLLSRLAPLLIDHSSLLELSRYMSDIIDGDTIGKEEASRIINRATSIYKALGELYPSNLNQREIIDILISKFLESKNEFVVKSGLQCIRAMLAKEAGVDGVNVRDEKWREGMKDALLELMKQGSPSCAKHAFRDICHLLGKNETWQLLQGYMEELMDTLDHREESTARSLVLLRKAVLECKGPLLEKIQAMYPIEIARKILVPDLLTYNGGETIGVDTSQMKAMVDIPVSPSMKNTLCAIKLAVRVLPLFPEGEHSTSLIQKTITVLSLYAQEKGMVVDDITITEADAAWLTAMSGSALVRLLSNRRLSTDSNFFKPSLMSALAQVSTHPCEAVRNYFLDRLLKYYRMPVTLTSPFIALIPLSLMAIEKGVESDEDEKRQRHRVCDIFVQCIQYRYQSLLSMNSNDVLLKNEFFAPHFVSLLAESPRLCNNKDKEELTKITEVLWYCVETLSTRVRGCINWDLIVALLNQLKTVTPKMEKMEDEEDSVDEMAKKVWAISEIFLHLIVYKAKIPTTHSEKNAPLLRSFYVNRRGGNSNVYAPTELLKRIEQGKIQHEFNRLKISSTLSKEESKKESKSRGRGRRKKVQKEEESDEEIDEDEEAMMPSTSRRGQKVMETVEEEDEDMEMANEEKEEKKMRGRGSQRTTLPPVNRRLTSMRELESIDLSPIVTMGGVTRRVGGLAVSTPIAKNGIEIGGIKGMRGVKMEKGIDATPTKKGRGRPPSTSPIKLPSQSASSSPLKSPAKSPPTAGRQNGTRKRSSKKEEEGDEEKEEDDTPPAKRGRGRAAVKKENGKEESKKIPSSSSNSRKGRGKKKAESEDEKDESEEEKEEETLKEEKEVEKPVRTRSGRNVSTKKTVSTVIKKKK